MGTVVSSTIFSGITLFYHCHVPVPEMARVPTSCGSLTHQKSVSLCVLPIRVGVCGDRVLCDRHSNGCDIAMPP